MGLATKIVEFFNLKTAPSKIGKTEIKSIKDFLGANPGVDLLKVVEYCSILERENILLKITAINNSLLGPCYLSLVALGEHIFFG